MRGAFRFVPGVFSSVIFAALLAVFLAPPLSRAAEFTPYTKAAFLKAQGAGKTIIVGVHADW